MAWIITQDRISEKDERSDVGRRSVDFDTFTGEGRDKHMFRLLDDDGEIYYMGFCSELTHAPLDDFGLPNAGCTTMQYYENYGWHTL